MLNPISQFEQVKCLSLKEKAQKTVSDTKTAVITAITSFSGALLSKALAPVKSVKELAGDALDFAEKTYNQLIDLPQTISKSSAEKRALVEKKFKELKEPTKCDITLPSSVQASTVDVTTSPAKITTNVYAQIMASPSSNEKSLQASTVYKQKKQQEDSNSKSISEKQDVAYAIIKSTEDDSIPTMREKLRQIYGKNPKIDEMLKTIPLGTPMSEYVGAWILGDVLDKPSLNLISWGDGTPKVFRKNIKTKLSVDVVNDVENAYTITNNRLYENLPKEFKDQQKTIGIGTSHSYHIAGDFGYYKNHTNPETYVGKLVASTTLASIGVDNKLINYINPVIEEIIIENDTILAFEENYEVPIDNRKNIVRLPIKNNVELTDIKK